MYMCVSYVHIIIISLFILLLSDRSFFLLKDVNFCYLFSTKPYFLHHSAAFVDLELKKNRKIDEEWGEGRKRLEGGIVLFFFVILK